MAGSNGDRARRTVDAWREWGKAAPAYAIQFYGGELEADRSISDLCNRHGDAGVLDELEALARKDGTRITIILQPEGEW